MLLALVVCVVGLIMYFIATNPKVAEIGHDMFWVGLLVTLVQSGPYIEKIVIR